MWAHDGLSEATSVCVVITMMKRGRGYREKLSTRVPLQTHERGTFVAERNTAGEAGGKKNE
jgi:hypothetical protein